MQTKKNIPGIYLVTRPEEKSNDFIRYLSSKGVQTRSLPMISIEPINFLDNSEIIYKKLSKLFEFDLAIFISSFSVSIFDSFLKTLNLNCSNELNCIAIGSQTAKAIQEKGWKLDESCIFDDSKYKQTSEVLLSLPPLREVSNKNIMIVRGFGGREILSDVLRKRGANVEYLELYNRIPKTYELNELIDSLGIRPDKLEVNAILFASGEALQSFYKNIQKYKLFNQIKEINLIVPSKRLYKMALDLGFMNINCAINASSYAFLDEIQKISSIRSLKNSS